ncbi:glycoside hydrolase family 3 N-terminal domain-containing protein [Pontibacter sp. G13]|uniref:glycoside hydrolase family 3 N-terminal domain-containing protein n=1 Tax=Pontibacter sp. G13 TaxID=3074898 RepID=UPI00288BCA30|nr:glycoside hydrolase family 3 N-terminal domain-containing protein [Pontibacter sp. G13]WNJ21608.1 glycoside hydrolase family 3 N-terminal domain-containing protein [Pontibacter sp. G13]
MNDQFIPDEAATRMTELRQREAAAHPEIEARVQSLLEQMTLPEKVGQMTQITHSAVLEEVILNEDGSPGDDFSLDPNKVETLVRDYHIGSFLNGIAVSAEEWYAYSQTVQETNLRTHRLQIPIIYGIDHMHGTNYVDNATIFPHRLNLAATFDPAHSAAEARVIGRESADLGHPWIFAPVLDIGRNPHFPRFYETYGEDPILCSRMGAAFVEALQDHDDIAPYKQAACAKHFIGYSDPRSGWDRGPAEISDQTLYEFFVPPFRAAVDAGVKTFMINGGEINGIPVHASYRLLTGLLREELGFEGVAVTDWEDVIRLHTVHRVAETPKEAVYIAIMAGVDMSMTPFTTEFCDLLVELVEEGRIPMERIDLSVARILRLKFDLGLFDHPYPRNDRFDRIKAPEHVAASLQAARESLVLMTNDGTLPLTSGKRVLLGGPQADSKQVLAGGWTLRWIPDREEQLYPEDMHTLYTAMQESLGEDQVILASGDDWAGAAADVDAIVMAVGELPYSEGSGNIYDMTLERAQLDAVRAAIDTGKPVVLVVIAGRPRLISAVYGDCAAVVWAGLPGFEGGQAIAELLSGAINPSGKLPFSYPAHSGHWHPYNHKLMDLGHYQGLVANETHLATFGHGLSYTNFAYADLELSADRLTVGGSLTATVRVSNTGDRAGYETVLWFLQDEIGSVTRPVRELREWARVWLEPGESREVSFEIRPADHLAFWDAEGQQRLETGDFRLWVGDQEARFRLD